MSDSPKEPEVIPKKVIDLLVSNTLSKNGVNLDEVKGKISDEQKQLLKELVEELTVQVNEFVEQLAPPKKDSK